MKLSIERPLSSSQKANLKLYASSSYAINDFYGYNDDFITLLLVNNDSTNNIDVYLKQSKYEKITTDLTSSVSESVGSYDNIWESGSTLRFGDTASLNHFTIQEIRYWNQQISDTILNEHVLSPHSYNSNNPTGSFYDLSLRLPLIDKFDVNVTQSISPEQPNYSITEFANYIWTGDNSTFDTSIGDWDDIRGTRTWNISGYIRFTRDNATAHSGIRISMPVAYRIEGATYRIKFICKGTMTGSKNFVYIGQVEDTSFTTIKNPFITSGWQEYEMVFTWDTTHTNNIEIGLGAGTVGNFFDIDNVLVEYANPISASFNNFSQSNFEGINETHYIVNPSIGNQSIFSDKIIIETSDTYDHLVLDKDRSTENVNNNTKNSNNNRVGIYFSPQNIINEDIFKHAGYFRIDDYIGDPESLYKAAYPDLTFFSQEYWKKYQTKNNLGQYLRLFKLYDFSIFNQINQTLPERSNKILGLLIEPNILERNRIETHLPSRTNNLYDIHIPKDDLYAVTGSVSNYEGEISRSYSVLTNDYTHYTASIENRDSNTITSSYNHHTCSISDYKNYDIASRYVFHDLLFITSSGALIISTGSYTINGLQPFISSSITSNYKEILSYFYSSSNHEYQKVFYSSSYKAAETQDYMHTSWKNLKYDGCQVTAADINVENNDIYQNKPVVEVIEIDSGELISSEYDSDGNFDVV